MKSLKDLTSIANSYLERTTIHGCLYISKGQNTCEKLIWSMIISVCLLLALLLISQSIEEASNEPILTTLTTTKILHGVTRIGQKWNWNLK